MDIHACRDFAMDIGTSRESAIFSVSKLFMDLETRATEYVGANIFALVISMLCSEFISYTTVVKRAKVHGGEYGEVCT